MRDGVSVRRRGERGFALVLAILSLMLLTFLGLTLATTTSTELQIATNYRWSQQALYNAEAGLEAARIVLANAAQANPTSMWNGLLPTRRLDGSGMPVVWLEGAAPGPAVPSTTGRDYYRSNCDTRGGVGYGLVLSLDSVRYENQSAFGGKTLNGAFTLWVRRKLAVDTQGRYQDSDRNDLLVIVSEGVAPYSGAQAGTNAAFVTARQARRILETELTLGLQTEEGKCETMGGQEGFGPSGDNYNPCAPLVAGAGGSVRGLEAAFGATVTNRSVE
jgi:hypothetical protein